MTVYRHSRAQLARGIIIALLLGLAIGWLAKPLLLLQPVAPAPTAASQPAALVNATPMKSPIGRPTFEQVRQAWGIEGPLHCAAGPFSPHAENR